MANQLIEWIMILCAAFVGYKIYDMFTENKKLKEKNNAFKLEHDENDIKQEIDAADLRELVNRANKRSGDNPKTK